MFKQYPICYSFHIIITGWRLNLTDEEVGKYVFRFYTVDNERKNVQLFKNVSAVTYCIFGEYDYYKKQRLKKCVNCVFWPDELEGISLLSGTVWDLNNNLIFDLNDDNEPLFSVR